jgi:hypothetical protein
VKTRPCAPGKINAPPRSTSQTSRRRHSDFFLGGANLSRAQIGKKAAKCRAEFIKAYGQSIWSDKGLTANHKGDWLIAEAYDAKGASPAPTSNFLQPSMMRMPQLWIRKTFQNMLALTTCRKRSLMFLIAGYGLPHITHIPVGYRYTMSA